MKQNRHQAFKHVTLRTIHDFADKDFKTKFDENRNTYIYTLQIILKTWQPDNNLIVWSMRRGKCSFIINDYLGSKRRPRDFEALQSYSRVKKKIHFFPPGWFRNEQTRLKHRNFSNSNLATQTSLTDQNIWTA